MSSNWVDKIPGAFGCEDKKFAGHPCDIDRAVKLIEAANEQGVGFNEYCQTIHDWLNRNCGQLGSAFIDEQMEKVRSLESYFRLS